MTVLKVKDLTLAEDLAKKRRSPKTAIDATLESNVKEIIREVRAKGDTALINFTKKYENTDLRTRGIRVSETDIQRAREKVSEKEISALKRLKKRIEKVEGHKARRLKYSIKEKGLQIFHTLQPIESVGCYVPGGKAPYPSTLLMTATPAKVAGVPRVVVCSPPTSEGEIEPIIMVAASLCGVDEIYRLGGVQAIAALAYGTESIRSVRKIVGPGNRFVTLAKIVVSHDVAIDLPAGPSEVVILADQTADPRLIALDLISQSEHTSDNISGLVTTSKDLATAVVNEVETLIVGLKRKAIVEEALTQNGFIFVFPTMGEAIAFVNAFAPEHLEIVARKATDIVKKITSAGIIFLGKYTPVSAGDYGFGTNHVLPTAGFGHVYSELSIFDYVKRMNVVKCSKKKLRQMQPLIKTLANSEGLTNHSAAIHGRFHNA